MLRQVHSLHEYRYSGSIISQGKVEWSLQSNNTYIMNLNYNYIGHYRKKSNI